MSRAGGTALIELLGDSVARSHITVVDGSGERASRGGLQLLEEAARRSTALGRDGVGAGDVVLLVAGSSMPLVETILGIWMLGGIVCLAYPPLRSWGAGGEPSWLEATYERLQPHHIVMGETVAASMPEIERGDAMAGGLVWAVPGRTRPAAGPGGRGASMRPTLDAGTALVQLTSGSTGARNGIQVSAGCVEANVDAVRSRLAIDDDDLFVSWLPLHHDMGLIGNLLLATLSGADLVLIDTGWFARSPRTWFDECSRCSATFTSAPGSAYAVARRTLDPSTHDLRRLRLALNGSEPIDVGSFNSFVLAASACGMDPRAAMGVYGLAEATVGVTVPEVGSGFRRVSFDRQAYVHHGTVVEPAPGSAPMEAALVGVPVAGVEVQVVAREGRGVPVGEDVVGAVEARGRSVADRSLDGPLPTRDGWYDTGDLGFVHDGQLVIAGRSKAEVIKGGVNYLAEDIERVAGAVDGVRAGNVAALGVQDGREELVLLVEARQADGQDLRQRIASAVRRTVGVAPDRVVVLDVGTLPKTSSGKIARAECRLLAEELLV